MNAFAFLFDLREGTSRVRMFTFLFGDARELEKLAARASHSLF